MLEVIGSLLPFAFTIALGPIPIIAIAIMLQTADPGRTSAGFAAGWLVGMALIVTLLTMLASLTPDGDADHPKFWIGVVQIVIGLGLLALTVKKVRKWLTGPDEPSVPKFLGSLADTTPQRSLLVGFVAAAINPKHVALLLPVGTLIALQGLSSAEAGVAIIVFVLVASLTVAGTALAYAISPDPVGKIAHVAYTWMVRNMSVVSAAVFLLIGVNILGKGISNLG